MVNISVITALNPTLWKVFRVICTEDLQETLVSDFVVNLANNSRELLINYVMICSCLRLLRRKILKQY